MRLILTATAAVAGLSLALPAPALSRLEARQSVPEVAVGMNIVDEAGNPVGRVESIQGDDVLIRTDIHQARIPRSSIRQNRGRLEISMTRAQLNAAVERLTPPAPVEIAPGVTVRGSGGDVAGTIESVEQGQVILRLGSGDRVSLPRSSVGTNARGAFITITTEELERRLAAALQVPANDGVPDAHGGDGTEPIN